MNFAFLFTVCDNKHEYQIIFHFELKSMAYENWIMTRMVTIVQCFSFQLLSIVAQSCHAFVYRSRP